MSSDPSLDAFERFDADRAEETGYDRLIDALESHGSHRADDSDTNGNNEMWQCPAHDDAVASLSVKKVKDRVIYKCHAGCGQEAVTDALGVQPGALFDNRYDYVYTDREGKRVKTKHRAPGKRFHQSGDTSAYILFRLPEVWRAVEEGRDVWLVEGEKDVMSLELLGETATTTGAVTTLAHADLSPLFGANVKCVIDNDLGGDRWARDVLAALDGLVESLTFYQAARGKDVTDHLTAGLPLADLVPMVPAQPSPFEQEVAAELRKALVREEVKHRLANQGQAPVPETESLADLLAEPDEPVYYRVEGMMPLGGRTLLAAQAKAGKTTLVGNLVRCLVDDDLFLDTAFVMPAKRVVLLDDEMSREQIKRWMRLQGIKNAGAIDLVSLRGKVSTFNILDPRTRSMWAKKIAGADVLVVDCLRPILDALGLSEDKDAGRFLVALDALADEAGVTDVVLVHHMGHGAERSRGDSRLLDWPDANWEITRLDKDDKTSGRFLSAWGRDVEVQEAELVFDPTTKRLSMGLGSKRDAKAAKVDDAVLAYVGANPGQNTTDVKNGVGLNVTAVGKALPRLAQQGLLIRVETGTKNALLHYLPGDEPSAGPAGP